MGPKPKKPEESQRTIAFAEVDRAMYDLQIADLNRKLARLRAAITDYEIRNEELQKAYDQLDEDRADIIAYLKKTLNTKNEENTELKERVKGLEELREQETLEFNEKVAELEKNFTTMKDQLTSDNKLLAGKINTLEEFRAIREDLMKKFEKQEKAFEDQEMKYKRIVYDAEKKFVIGKDKLKREMEARLLQLAQDFQDASETRIAASTHRVIRENIALNNQLDNILYTQAKVAEQNEKYREDERAARNALEVAEAERDKAINKSIVQLKVIDQLTAAFQNVEKNKALHDRKVYDLEHLQAKVQKLTKENESMILQIRILEQNLHASLGEQNKYVVETAKLIRERDKYKQVIKDTTFNIQSALKMDQWAAVDPTREVMERKVVLKNILSVINKHRLAVRAESIDSLVSFSDVYEKGDLGFVPKPAPGFTKPRKSKTSITSDQSQETIETKRSSPSISTSVHSVTSLKTIPSITILPEEESVSIISKESIPSFTVTSLHSSISTSEAEPEDSFEAMNDVEKQLALSKLEIQKSILKDLALSQPMLASKSRPSIQMEPSLRGIKSRASLSEPMAKRASSVVTFEKKKIDEVGAETVTAEGTEAPTIATEGGTREGSTADAAEAKTDAAKEQVDESRDKTQGDDLEKKPTEIEGDNKTDEEKKKKDAA